MAEKIPGSSRKSTSPKKSSATQSKTVTPISQGSSTARTENVPVKQFQPGIEDEIRRRAYELFEERGRLEGFDEQDWARAEAEVLARYQRGRSA